MTRRALMVAIPLLFLAALWGMFQIFNIGVPCVYYALSGLYCPGCGATRAIDALAHFHVLQAFRFNAYFCVLLPFLAVYLLFAAYRYIRWGTVPGPTRYDKVVGTVFIVTAILFAVIRNSSTGAFLAPTIIG